MSIAGNIETFIVLWNVSRKGFSTHQCTFRNMQVYIHHICCQQHWVDTHIRLDYHSPSEQIPSRHSYMLNKR